MSKELFQRIEERIDEILTQAKTERAQLLEAEERNALLLEELHTLKSRQQHWEKNLATLLRKLDENESTQKLSQPSKSRNFDETDRDSEEDSEFDLEEDYEDEEKEMAY